MLQAELYAVAALAGAAVVALGYWLGIAAGTLRAGGAGLCFGLRIMAMHYGWHLPVALKASDPPPPEGPRR